MNVTLAFQSMLNFSAIEDRPVSRDGGEDIDASGWPSGNAQLGNTRPERMQVERA